MTDTTSLKRAINERGLKMSHIAERLGVARYTLLRKLKGETEFSVDEAKKICEIIGITDPAEKEKIFFADKVEE